MAIAIQKLFTAIPSDLSPFKHGDLVIIASSLNDDELAVYYRIYAVNAAVAPPRLSPVWEQGDSEIRLRVEITTCIPDPERYYSETTLAKNRLIGAIELCPKMHAALLLKATGGRPLGPHQYAYFNRQWYPNHAVENRCKVLIDGAWIALNKDTPAKLFA